MRSVALLLSILAVPAAAQIHPGRIVGAVQAGTGSPVVPMVLVEPLAGTVDPIFDPAQLLTTGVQAVLPRPAGQPPIAAIGSLAGSAYLARIDLVGNVVTAVTRLSPDLGEPVVALIGIPGSAELALATPTRLLAIDAAGASRPLDAARLGETFLGIAPLGGHLAVLAVGSGVVGPSIHMVAPATGLRSVHPIAIPAPRALAFDPTLGGLVVGNSSGDLFLVDPARFIVSHLAGLGAPITAIAHVEDQDELAVATARGVVRFASGVPSAPIPTPPLTSLAYAPYESTFRIYGAGCAAANIAPTLAATGTPHPGSADFVVRLSRAAPNSSAFLLIGLAPRHLPLDPIGMPTCVMLVDPLDALPTRTSRQGTASIRMPIPPDPDLAGATLRLQWIAVAPGANVLQLLLSAGGLAVL